MENVETGDIIVKRADDKDSVKITKTTKGYNFEIKKYGESLEDCINAIDLARSFIYIKINKWLEEEQE